MVKSISIVIPAYNEERDIEKCLRSIARQTVMPDEVIVVDNNSTDRTAEIAASFSFVKIVSESRQGRGFAYSAGFDAASSDIIGRINADSWLYPNWVELVKKAFTDDDDLGGLSGLGVTDTLPGTHFWMTKTWSHGYFLWNQSIQRVNTLWGANAAISRQAWLAVRDDVCKDDALVHDDQDLAYLLAGKGYPVRRNNRLLIRAHTQHYHLWPKLREYTRRRDSTKRLHEQKGTLDSPGALVLPIWVVLRVWLLGALPLSLFFGVSYLRYILFSKRALRTDRD